MAQVSKISQLNVDNLIPSGGSKASSAKSNFSDILTTSTSNTKQYTKNDSSKESVLTTKQKLQETNAASSKLNQTDTKDTVQADDVENNGMENVDSTEQTVENVQDQVQDLKNQIAKILNISVDELEKVMSESGLNVMDLLDPSMLQNLLLQVNNVSEPTELLTNEALCNQLTELLQTVESFKETIDLEQFTKVNDFVTSQEFSEVLQETVQPAVQADKTADDIKSEQTADIKPEQAVKQEPVITVQKEELSDSKNETSDKGKKDEQGDNHSAVLNQFVQNLSDSVQTTTQTVSEGMERIQQMQEIVNQVVERIKVVIGSDSTNMEIQLNPEHLGKVNLSVISKNGEMTASFTVENQLAKEALESQMSTLRENLSEQGIKVEAIEVTVAQQGLSQDQFSNQGGQNFQNQTKRQHNSGKLKTDDESDSETEEEEVPQRVRSNGTVEFSA